MKKFYTTTQAAEMYGYSLKHILFLINDGQFGVVRKGKGRNGHFRLSDENLQTFDNNLLKL